MALPELMGEVDPFAARSTTSAVQSAEDTLQRLAAALEDVFLIYNVDYQEHPTREGNMAHAVVFQGKLLADSEPTYPILLKRYKALGYTPLLRRKGNLDLVILIEGTIQPRRINSPVWLHIALLLLTIITATLSGAQFQGAALNMRALQRGDLSSLGTVIQAGAPFALTLLLILGVHEMGHYFAARRHKVDVTLPYFIPFPFFLLGTLGAVIFIKSPLNNRKALFDVGISGPLAGFVVALIAYIIGLFLPPSGVNSLLLQGVGNERIGMPILLQGIGDILRPDLLQTYSGRNISSLSVFVARQPIAFAAWFGMLLTVLNLLPIGQLDGGHVMYTLFGEAAWTIAVITFAVMIFLGLTIFPSLLFFALLAFLTGLRHPPPGDDITPLDPRRKLIGYATIVLFFLIGTATPFTFGR
ncbi:MAG: site-2 protease family protein [Candidatus Thermofonsia Clade 1 bacterium]|uniref:Site-2 protease family protein n=1 Tax=Candidatus Thermofonsia Clade 1 bacterium TaxID=2364210 RepID=A0A2M8P480_9CHLR|nr:MAG: site-2 protease family protein [Candidatus Thermofonsia Clade 1 bacterium]